MKNQTRGFVSNSTLIGLAVVAILFLIGVFMFFSPTEVEGNQYAIKETWSNGVDPTPLAPKTYMRNRFSETFYIYDMSGQVFVMNDKSSKVEKFAEGRTFDTLEVKSSDNQRVHFFITMQWHRDFNKLVEMHKQYRDSVEERLIRPEVIRVMVAHATIKQAIDLYSGQALEDLRKVVELELKKPEGALRASGVLVDAFIIDKTDFPDKEYVSNIEARQRAIIAESRAREEKKANEAKAEAARAEALTKQNQDLVKAETDKKVAILRQEAESSQGTIKAKADALNAITAQEAESQKIVLQAKADAEKQIAISVAQKEAEVNRAVGIEAIGRAEAEAQRLKLTAFSVPGSEIYARVEISKQFGAAMAQTKFYPSNATFNTIASDFEKGLSLLVGGAKQ